MGAAVASNYQKICEDNRRRYGTEGALKSGGLAAQLYDDRTHFIFELLQNAEDALGRRGSWDGARKVSFTLGPNDLTLSHFGKPFDESDVRSVCDIAESTKNETSIGRFGLGFKSVYTVTDLPQIHSGEEDFAIEEYVFPKGLERSARDKDETQIVLPLKQGDATAAQDIAKAFRQLGPGALLFLRHIDEINWRVENGPSGFYLRNAPETLGPNVQRITLVGAEDDRDEVDENWLVFHRDVFLADQKKVGRVEIAFSLVEIKDASVRWAVQPLAKSPLVVFFPTVVESHLGFLVQGPYRTTPSRDNIPPGEPWNQHLIKETSSVLVEAMCWMRDSEMLDVSALRCLPLEREKFPKDSRFAPMFDAVRQAFLTQDLLPTFDGGHITASQARLARTQELRELFNPEQVATLFDSEITAWLTGDITQDRAPEIRHYVMRELGVSEVTPETIIPRLNQAFLEAQPDDWISTLYKFLGGQPALKRRLEGIPLIRLSDGSHVTPRANNGEPQAFLPGAFETGFPTISKAVCANPDARAFLISLNITEPDLVDDVVLNVLQKYRSASVGVDDNQYANDIGRILSAYNTDSKAQREKLLAALKVTRFVKVVDAGNGNASFVTPGEAYIATERLLELFAGISGILIVDSKYNCLRGEDIRDLLVSCGASRYLIPQQIQSDLGLSEKEQIRREAGLERSSWQNDPEDFTLRGLAQLLDYLPTLKPEDAAVRAKELWEALTDLEARGTAAFFGTYKWGYSHETKIARFDAAFIRVLNKVAWVPSANGELVTSRLVVFDTLGWKSNLFLQAKIAFKPPIIDQLAKEVGIDPAALDLLRQHGITSLADLTSRLGINPAAEPEPSKVPNPEIDDDVYDGAKDLYGDDMPDIPPGTPDPDGGDDVGMSGGRRGQGRSSTGTSSGDGQGNGGVPGSSSGHGTSGNKSSGKVGAQGKRTPGQSGGRPFISYVGTHTDEDSADPDGLDQAERMRIEKHAIDLIIQFEPMLRRTVEGNPGFDLYESDSTGKQTRWVEVKSMTGSLSDRPVGLSSTQFEFAREKGNSYWLYVVEYVNIPNQVRVLKIQDPATLARTFTFDKGWTEVAEVEVLYN